MTTTPEFYMTQRQKGSSDSYRELIQKQPAQASPAQAKPPAAITRARFAQAPIDLLEQCGEHKGRLFVYLWLWHYAGRDDEAWPSLDRLAAECRMNRDDVREARKWLCDQGWIAREDRPGMTPVFHVRSENLPSKRMTPPPNGGPPKRGTPPPNGGPHPSPKRGTPPLPQTGDPNKKTRTRGFEQEEIQETPPPPLAGGSRADSAVAADRPQPDTQALRLPTCAEPHRALVVRWWKLRKIKHPAAPQQLDQRSHDAILHADAEGVLQPFLAWAAEQGPRTLGHGYRQRIAALSSPAGDAEGFERFKVAYLAAKKRASSQNLPKARVAFSRALAAGHTAEQLIGALRANVQAQNRAERDGGFAAALPDMARWLRDGLYEAHLGQDSQNSAVAAVAPSRSVSRAAYPDDLRDLPDPFAAYRS